MGYFILKVTTRYGEPAIPGTPDHLQSLLSNPNNRGSFTVEEAHFVHDHQKHVLEIKPKQP